MPDDCTLSFDYVVDSEMSFDRLEVWLDAETLPRFFASGSHSEHKIIKGIPAGTHTVRFQYAKDASASAGADTTWVDNIRAADTNGRVFYESCRDVWATPTAPWGWTSGGHGGGMTVVEPPPDRAVQRPAAQYHLANSYSWMRRTVNVASGTTATLHYNYYVDSEENDHLFVFVNGQVRHTVSGAGQSGHGRIDLSAGANTITFAYEKNGSVDAGLDVATVDNIRLTTPGAPAQELGDFRGAAPFDSPGSHGWTSGGSPATLAWQARPKAQHITHVDASGSALAPAIDGIVDTGTEYGPRSTAIPLFRYRDRPSINPPVSGPMENDATRLILAGKDSQKALYLVLIAKSENADAGNESGDVDLYFDRQRVNSLSHVGCAQGVSLPAEDDRKIRISYYIYPGGRPLAPTVTQWKGTCTKAAPWTAVAPQAAWRVEAATRESDEEEGGRVTIELKVTLPESLLTSRQLGLGVYARTPRSSSATRPSTEVQLPYANAPQDADVLAWETLSFAPWRISDAPTDGCCGPGQEL